MAAIAAHDGKLPDPRRYGTGESHPLVGLAAAGPEGAPRLVGALREMLLRGADGEARRALAAAPDRATHARLWHALCAASEGAGASGESVVATVYALPLVIVTGARGRAVLPGTAGDAGALLAVLERAGALGASRNAGLGNALVALDALEALAASSVLAWRSSGGAGEGRDAPPPAAIAVRPGEEVHLRFLLGAAVTAAAAPSLLETASHVGAWGLAFGSELRRQLAAPGVELLVLARPPRGILRATYEGRRAQLGVALDLFLSNAIRRARAAAGEPALVVSIHEPEAGAAELRVSVSAALDETLLEGYRWPLHPLDDPNEIADSVRRFAAECRLHDVRVAGTVLPDRGPGAAAFVRAAALPPLAH
ncbi:MAG: hypothetical protein IT529_19385 [Burkholderiales bacterium]|nr:hypothetical protein [Burkholderiales bacterium]